MMLNMYVKCSLRRLDGDILIRMVRQMQTYLNYFFYRYNVSSIPNEEVTQTEQNFVSPFRSVEMLFPTIKDIFIDYNTTLSSTGVIQRMFSNTRFINLVEIGNQRNFLKMVVNKNSAVLKELNPEKNELN